MKAHLTIGDRGIKAPRLPCFNSTKPYCDMVFRVRDRFDSWRPESSANSVSDAGCSREMSDGSSRIRLDSTLASVSKDVNHTFASTLTGLCSPRGGLGASLHLVVAGDADLQRFHGFDPLSFRISSTAFQKSSRSVAASSYWYGRIDRNW